MTTADMAFSGTVIATSSHVTVTETSVVADLSSYSLPVTVTAGLEKLSTATGTGANSAATTGASSAASSSTATGGVPRATQNAVLVGAAAIAGGALLI